MFSGVQKSWAQNWMMLFLHCTSKITLASKLSVSTTPLTALPHSFVASSKTYLWYLPIGNLIVLAGVSCQHQNSLNSRLVTDHRSVASVF